MLDPFQTLGIEARFDLDASALAARHRELSRALHPDKYAGAPAQERRMSLSRAIEVNDAFRVLRDPVSRAEALLRKHGASVGETNEPKPSPALLMEMMELREELGDARHRKDLGAVQALALRMRDRESETLKTLSSLFDDVARGDRDKLEPIVLRLGELRYVRRFLDEASLIEEDLSS